MLVAAILVGPEGKVIGADPIPEMLERARTNLKKTSLKSVTFSKVLRSNYLSRMGPLILLFPTASLKKRQCREKP
jgi:tRNA A58 N-methylase Trm61